MEKKIDSLRPSMDERKSRSTRKYSRADIITDHTKAFVEKYGESLYRIIRTTDFEDGEDNHATRSFAELMAENKSAAMKLIYDLYVQNTDDEYFCKKVLTILGDYTYDEFFPYSRKIAISSLTHESKRVKSSAYNLMAHWGWDSKAALEFLENVEVPSDPWLLIEYNSIKSSLERLWSTRAK